MAESSKDSNSHSSEGGAGGGGGGGRGGSAHSSGHTSADEVDTTTSSDIEIISHISTPNGCYRLDAPPTGGASGRHRQELSPRHQGGGRRARAASPPTHRRSDSGSSAQSLQSRTSEDQGEAGGGRGRLRGGGVMGGEGEVEGGGAEYRPRGEGAGARRGEASKVDQHGKNFCESLV